MVDYHDYSNINVVEDIIMRGYQVTFSSVIFYLNNDTVGYPFNRQIIKLKFSPT